MILVIQKTSLRGEEARQKAIKRNIEYQKTIRSFDEIDPRTVVEAAESRTLLAGSACRPI
jgi:hypothetical protein